MEFKELVEKKAKENKAKIVMPEGFDPRVIEAAAKFTKEGFGEIVLLGDPNEITEKAKELGHDISKCEIMDYLNYEKLDEMADALAELRKHKGVTKEKALELLKDYSYFGCMMAKMGLVDGVSGSCVCPTADLMRPALQIIKTKPGVKLVTEMLISHDPKDGKTYFFSDGSLNIEPTPEELCQIGLNAADFVNSFEITPKVAFLSFSTRNSGQSEVYKGVIEATKMAQEARPKYIIDGEMQGDAAVNPDAARRKCPDSPIKGDANILITPNLTCGNILLHLLMQLGRLETLYMNVLGIAKPVAILGRSSPADRILNVTIMCAAQVER